MNDENVIDYAHLKVDKEDSTVKCRKTICGIYCISNSKYFYIGQSRNIYARWTYHKRRLKINKHHNTFFQRVYNKYYLEDPFIFEVIELCESQYLTIRESNILKSYINEFKNKKPLNLVEPCESWSDLSIDKFKNTRRGKKHSEETKRKISEGQKGKKVKSIQVKVVQISVDGELIKIWDSIKEASETLNIKINVDRKTCKGFQFQRYNDYLISPKGKLNSNKISIKQFDINGEFIKEWDSMLDAAKELNLNPGNISNVIRGYQKTTGGFIWKS